MSVLRLVRIALLTGTALMAVGVSPAQARDEPVKLRDTFVDGSLELKTRRKAALALLDLDPEMFGEALFTLAERKDPAQLPLIAGLTVAVDVRHLQAVATHAAYTSDPKGVVDAYLKLSEDPDPAIALRALRAAGLVIGVDKKLRKTGRARLLAKAADLSPNAEGSGSAHPSIAAIQAVARLGDKRASGILAKLAIQVPDDHVRQHIVWAMQDVMGKRGALKPFGGASKRKDDNGRRAKEALELLMDEQALPFKDWNPEVLKNIPTWWKKGRSKDLQPEITIKDAETKKKVEGFLKELDTTVPRWGHLVRSTVHKIGLRTRQQEMVFDPKTKTLFVTASELLRCQTDWQGAYVLARYSTMGFSALQSEPLDGHRGWEPAYVQMHAFYRATKRMAGKLDDFVEKAVDGKPWQ